MPEPAEILATVAPIEPREGPSGVELRLAMVCLGCDWVYPTEFNDCPRCHSAVRFPLARVLAPLHSTKGEP